MSYSSPRVLTPKAASRKRKEMESVHIATSSSSLTSVTPAVSVPKPTTTSYKGPGQHQPSSNRLLAGYMALEFLSKGTLLGQRFEPARAEPRRDKPSQSSEGDPSGKPKPQCYADVSALLMSEGGAHIPGVVNPTQLARWIRM
ncbi:uncharacterized protein LOC127266432 [Andrographis paniculata]|uniref:uncharacterized protein LOC127266432 n=1 Tax=Andrographis paniculata TaxID=175694 RepID=UPI0021E750C3|nr:uncharacterized protein LOC127266432 [Andrographis paniculata]